MITIEIRERFARMKNGGFDRNTHDSFAYDVVLINDGACEGESPNPDDEGPKEIILQKGEFVIMTPHRFHEKQLAIDSAYRFAGELAGVIAFPNGHVPTYFKQFDVESIKASALALLSDEQRAALGV